jgi:hypothetical protein
MNIHIVKIITKVSLLAAMLLVTSVTPTQGQTLAYRIKANIPFDFSVGEKKLPAGTYSVSRVSQNSGDTVIAIADDDGRSKAIHLSNSAQRLNARGQATLVFRHYGDQYFLYQVWPAGATIGRQFARSRSEREIRKTLAANSSPVTAVETVTIVGVLQ